MERTEIVSLFKNTPADGTEITVCGWAKNIRDSKNIGFIALSDGGCFKTLQVVRVMAAVRMRIPPWWIWACAVCGRSYPVAPIWRDTA